jgi:hypothetical protein
LDQSTLYRIVPQLSQSAIDNFYIITKASARSVSFQAKNTTLEYTKRYCNGDPISNGSPTNPVLPVSTRL